VDRGVLDAALAADFPCGGWCPGDRMAEDGVIPDRYPLMPLPNGGYRARTRLNVVDSDRTAILYYESLAGGTRLTRNLCALLKRPYVLVDARQMSESEGVAAVEQFIAAHQVQILNVAGPRASGWKEGYEFALAVVSGVLADSREGLAAG
jgi:Circularly permutated YpsA SLOG family